jgi:hypothetical protein
MSITKSLSLALTFAAASTIAAAQPVPNKGDPSSAAASRLRVSATKPVLMVPKDKHGKFRMMFRLLAATDSEIPLAIIGYHNEALGWLAFTATGSQCKVVNVEGMSLSTGGYDTLEPLVKGLNQSKTTSEWHAHKTRPTIVVADFECDGPLSQNDGLTVVAKFYAYNGATWDAADFTFEGLTIASNAK